MKKTDLGRVLGAVLVVCAVSATGDVARAQFISLFDNLSQTQSSGRPLSVAEYAAQAFTTNGFAYTLTSATLILDGAGSVSLDLYNGTQQYPAGLPIANVNSVFVSSAPSNYLFTPTTTLALSPNTTYWLVASSSQQQGGEGPGWWYTSTTSHNPADVGFLPNFARSTDGGLNWSETGDSLPFLMQVLASQSGQQEVPEPASLAIWSLLAGMGACFAWRRRRAPQQRSRSAER